MFTETVKHLSEEVLDFYLALNCYNAEPVTFNSSGLFIVRYLDFVYKIQISCNVKLEITSCMKMQPECTNTSRKYFVSYHTWNYLTLKPCILSSFINLKVSVFPKKKLIKRSRTLQNFLNNFCNIFCNWLVTQINIISL